MSAQLYKPGGTYVVNGISCDIVNCSVTSVSSLLNDGWYASPEDFETEEETLEPEDASPEEIRALAKEAGIVGHDTKRIATLVKELEELTSGD